jgi:TonB family protein
MELGLTEARYTPVDRGKPRALAISVGLHVATFAALMYAPPISLKDIAAPSPSEYQQGFKGKEDKIVWYKFRDMPDLKPRQSEESTEPLKAEVRAKQSIVSFPKNAPKRVQVVITAAPNIDLPPLDMPNMVAVKLPPKVFTTPLDVVHPVEQKVAVPDALADLANQPLEAAALPGAKLPPRPFDAPLPAVKQGPSLKVAPPAEAPTLEAQALRLKMGLPATRLPARAYVPPAPTQREEKKRIAAVTEAPAAQMNAPQTANLPNAKLPARAYAPPPAAAPKEKKSMAAAEPVPQLEANAANVTMVIAGLNPANTPVTLPAASNPAQFSAGEKIRPDGAASENTGKGITVPDLFAHATGDAKPDLVALAHVPSFSAEPLNDALRNRELTTKGIAPAPVPVTPTSPAHPAGPTGTRVAGAPDPRFIGRDIFMMAIQMPNLTSYSGSWLMWYASRQPGSDPVAAPVAHRKVDPKYVPSAVDEHVEGKVQLYCVIDREGLVKSIELVRGADGRLNKSAVEALSKWEFYPATRNGLPVDVDVVVEIPFVLAPRTALK